MTTNAKTSRGAELWMAASGGTLIKVAELLTVEPPNRSRATIDATTHDSPDGAIEVIAEGIYDPGEVNATLHYIAGSATDDALVAAMTGGAKQDVKIVAKAATGTEDLEFSGYLTNYGPDPLGTTGKQTAKLSLKVSGPIAQSAT